MMMSHDDQVMMKVMTIVTLKPIDGNLNDGHNATIKQINKTKDENANLRAPREKQLDEAVVPLVGGDGERGVARAGDRGGVYVRALVQQDAADLGGEGDDEGGNYQ